MANTIQFKRGTAAALTSANPTLAAGEPCFETDTGRVKVGDGSTAWTSLVYLPLRRSGTSTGTGSDQEISHGFTAIPDRMELIPLEAGVTFTSHTVDTTHFHVTVTSGKDWAWVAESW